MGCRGEERGTSGEVFKSLSSPTNVRDLPIACSYLTGIAPFGRDDSIVVSQVGISEALPAIVRSLDAAKRTKFDWIEFEQLQLARRAEYKDVFCNPGIYQHVSSDNKKSPAKMAGQTNGTSLGMLIPNGSLREASEPAPGYSAFLEKIQAGSLTHFLILIKDQPFHIAE